MSQEEAEGARVRRPRRARGEVVAFPPKVKRPKVAITGGAGFLGSHLCERLLAEGMEVVCIDNLLTGNVANIEHLFGVDGFTFDKHDVTNYIWVPGRVDFVLHSA